MRLGARRFVGEHDFRNFCKVDNSKPASFVRSIVAFDVRPLASRDASDLRGRLCELRVCGTAFLWHQGLARALSVAVSISLA